MTPSPERTALLIAASGERTITRLRADDRPQTVYRDGRIRTLVMTMDVANTALANWWIGSSVWKSQTRRSDL